MKIRVTSEAGVNSLWCVAGASEKPSYVLHSILAGIPPLTKAKFLGSHWPSLKALQKSAHFYGLSVYKMSGSVYVSPA